MRRRPQFVVCPPYPRKPAVPSTLFELDMPPALVSFDMQGIVAPMTSPSAPGASPTPVVSYPSYPAPAPAPAPAPLPPPPPVPTGSSPVQVVIYGPTGPTPHEGTAVTRPDGSIELQVSVPKPPTSGTPVQVIIYDIFGYPTIYEGTAGTVGPDGSFPIKL